MEPLASLGSVSPVPPASAPAVLSNSAERDKAASHPPGLNRPVELAHQRLDPGDKSTRQRRTGPDLQAPLSEAATAHTSASARIFESSPSEEPSPKEEPASEADAPARRGVTYSLHPELALKFQSRVVDKVTHEILLSVPSELRVELAQRFEEHIGSQLDLYG